MTIKRRAILSVTDKTGLVDLGQTLSQYGYELWASGGTAKTLREADVEVMDVARVTGQEEILQGRVKTIHPAIAAGILAPSAGDLEGTGFSLIDLVVVNLYDFSGALARGESEEDLVESVDIGGPTLLRAAAKNFDRVTVLSDPRFYEAFEEELKQHEGMTSRSFRRRMAGEVMQRCSEYDRLIAGSLFLEEGIPVAAHCLRYGENPHQQAWWRVDGGGELSSLGLSLHGGKSLSYNNLVDLVAALKLAGDLPLNGCAVLKHTNPCGVGVADSVAASLQRALKGDPVSAFGGIVALRRGVDAETAEILAGMFLEVVAAPFFDEEARARLAKKKNLRWLSVDFAVFEEATRGADRRWGKLVLSQEEDEGFPELERFQLVGGMAPSEESLRAARLAWIVAKHVKSNSVVLADEEGTLGIGAGQMSRVDSCHLAVRKAKDAGLSLEGCIAASDGFFPFADGLEVLADAGVRTVIQPGGSIRDSEVVEAAERRGITLLHTGTRHFRH